MKTFIALIIALLCLTSTQGFSVRHAVVARASGVGQGASRTATSLNVFGNKKSAAAREEEESKYWQVRTNGL